MKPATKEKVLQELENLRNPPARTVPEKRIRVQCFGDFEIFADGKPIHFSRSKSKELLALLVDRRGAVCSAKKLAATLWDDGIYDRSRQKQFSTIRGDMIKSLSLCGAEAIIAGENDLTGVLPDKFDCDYYMALSGDSVAINSFIGEYMASYSWAEQTTAALTSRFGVD